VHKYKPARRRYNRPYSCHLLRSLRITIFATCALVCSLYVAADIEIETLGVGTFAGAGPHGILINNLSNQTDIYDADTAEMMGRLSLGGDASIIEIDWVRRQFLVAETYRARLTRGTRTDVVTGYDFDTLSAKREIVIPPKRLGGSYIRNNTGLTDDARFMLLNNITPAMSISVVDLENSTLASEIATAGCGLVYPTGNRSFLQSCGDGAVQLILLDDDGGERKRLRSRVFFDLIDEPIFEEAARTDDGWVFVSYGGKIFLVSIEGEKIIVQFLLQLNEGNEDWRPGGLQPLAYHERSDSLVILMHEGGIDSHKYAGTEVWLIKLGAKKLLHRLPLENISTAIEISQDDNPLLYSAFINSTDLDIYDLKLGKKTGSISGLTPGTTQLQNFQP